MRASTRAGAGALAAALLLAGCSGGSNGQTAPSPERTAPPASSTAAAPMDTDTAPTVAAPPTWDDQVAAQVIAQATGAVNAWIRKDLIAPDQQPAWWAGVTPYLSLGAQAAYAGTDPTQIKGKRLLRGALAKPVPESAHLAVAAVPTDVGPYTVQLSWNPAAVGTGGGWQVDQMTLATSQQ